MLFIFDRRLRMPCFKELVTAEEATRPFEPNTPARFEATFSYVMLDLFIYLFIYLFI